MKKVFVIDGNRFHDYKGFCEEFSTQVLSGEWTWRGSLDAFNDILRGGFGNIDCDEEFTVVWRNSNKSKDALGYRETVLQLTNRLETCHPGNEMSIIEKLNKAQKCSGPTVFDWILEIINEHENVTLILK